MKEKKRYPMMKKDRKRASGKITKLATKFTSKKYRDSYASSWLFAGIADQISSIRKERGLSQADLAEACGKKQSQISKLERLDNSEATLKTLTRIASAFDVALRIEFVSFNRIGLESVQGIRRELPKAFDEVQFSSSLREEVSNTTLLSLGSTSQIKVASWNTARPSKNLVLLDGDKTAVGPRRVNSTYVPADRRIEFCS